MPTFPATTVDFFLAGLESFMVRSGQGRHWAVTALWLKGKPEATALNRAWEQVHARHLMLGARLRRKWRGWRLVWETDGPVQAPPISWQPLSGQTDETTLIQERLRGFVFGQAITTPLFLEVFGDAATGRHLVLLTWRHALMDGTGVNLLLEKLAAPSDASPPSVPEATQESPALLYKRARPLMNRLHAMTRAGCLSAWSKGLPEAGGAPEFQLIQLTEEQSGRAAEKLRRLCGEFFQMPFYAAVAVCALRALHESRGWSSPEIHLHLPAQGRKRSPDLVFGGQFGTLPLFLESSALDTLDTAVAHVQQCYKDALKQGLPQASEALMALARQMPVRWFIPMVRLQNRGQICSLFHSHTGAFLPGRADFAGAMVENVCTVPSVSTPPGLGLFFSDFAGKITITLAWRTGGLGPEELKALTASITTDLAG
ncbi:MAG: hypothetical protein Q8M07_24570 [Prosthecobacter sp.]|nr:hypothetical protein [Prosthecobacter sp.]